MCAPPSRLTQALPLLGHELTTRVGAQVFGTVLKQLRMYDQRIIDARRLELNISRLLDADRDADIAAAFKYFLPLPEEEE